MDTVLHLPDSDEEETDEYFGETGNPYEDYFLSGTFNDKLAWQIANAASTPRPN